MYIYDATGVKLQKVVNDAGNIIKTTYASGFIYEETTEGEKLKFISHPEGYVEPVASGGFNYVYQYKDHLGNIRLSYSDTDGDGHIDVEEKNQDDDNDGVFGENEIVEENNYYPFGLKHNGYGPIISAHSNDVAKKFKYNGKELQDELGLNVYDYGARFYDPSAPHFWQIDPKAEEFNSQSPYVYAANNPIYFIDKDGMAPDWIREEEDGTITFIAEKGDSAWSLYTQHGKKDGFTAEQANDMTEGQLGENYIGKDGELKSDVEIGDEVNIYTEQEDTSEISMTKKEKALAYLDSMQKFQDDLGLPGDFFTSDLEQGIGRARTLIEDGDTTELVNNSFYDARMEDKGSFGHVHSRRKRSRTGKAKTARKRTSKARTRLKTVMVSGNKKTIHTGSRGGKYYINRNGNKTYLNRDGTKR